MTIRNQIKHLLGGSPALFKFIFKMDPLAASHRNLIFNSNTELVIEGFPRSANTFAVVFFETVQPRHVELAHHLHVECQLIWAARREVPGIALIRHPRDCVRSLLTREPQIGVSRALRRYVNFYLRLLPYRDRLLIAPFYCVVNNMSEVIQQCNSKFGTNFSVGEGHDPAIVNHVFAEIAEINKKDSGGRLSHVAHPVAGRRSKDVDIFMNCEPLLNEAVAVYESFISFARCNQ